MSTSVSHKNNKLGKWDEISLNMGCFKRLSLNRLLKQLFFTKLVESVSLIFIHVQK